MKKRLTFLLLAGITACSDSANKQEPAPQAPTNKAPIVEAGEDQVLPHGQMVTQLTGSYTDDSDSSRIDLQWQLTSGPEQVTFQQSNKGNTEVIFVSSGQYTFSFSVNDGAQTASDNVTVTVAKNQSPTADAGSDQVVNLNQGSADLVGSFSDDGPNDNIAVSWSLISGPASANIIQPEASATEVQFSEAGHYQFKYQVNDSEFSASDNVSVTVEVNQDSFGITQLHHSASSQLLWDSQHWHNQKARTISRSGDDDDPLGWSQKRGNTSFAIDGNGTMKIEDDGDQFRFYITPDQPASSAVGFVNIETTVYYQRLDLAGPVNAGLVVGIRSGADGHSSSGDYCDANTYYARFRHDGNWDLYKELKHPKGSIGKSGELFSNGQLPTHQWLGMKFVAYNNHDDSQVTLALYVDDTSGGDISKGDQWRKLAEIIDDGAWSVPSEDFDCSYPENKIISQGGGTVLIRNTSSSAQYRHVSIREITKPER